MCESSISPRMSTRPQLLTARSDLRLNVWGRNRIERDKKEIHIFKEGKSESSSNDGGERLDGGCGAPAASSSADCSGAHEDGEGRINILRRFLQARAHPQTRRKGKKRFFFFWGLGLDAVTGSPRMETPTRLWLNFYSFCVRGEEGSHTLSDKSAVGIVAQQVKYNNGRRGGATGWQTVRV